MLLLGLTWERCLACPSPSRPWEGDVSSPWRGHVFPGLDQDPPPLRAGGIWRPWLAEGRIGGPGQPLDPSQGSYGDTEKWVRTIGRRRTPRRRIACHFGGLCSYRSELALAWPLVCSAVPSRQYRPVLVPLRCCTGSCNNVGVR